MRYYIAAFFLGMIFRGFITQMLDLWEKRKKKDRQ
jgi:hypothetical protein